MTEAKLVILDVGHGLCAVLHDERGAVVFDYPGGGVPREFFRHVGIETIDAAFISHTHRDHCEGLTGNLGEDFPIDVILMNPRQETRSRLYGQVIKAIEVAKLSPNPPRLVRFNADVRESCMDRGAVKIEILGPRSVIDYVDGEGTPRDQDDEHTHCGVAKVSYEHEGRVLLPGDLNRAGFEAIVGVRPDALKAEVLVFPHHGGLSGGSEPVRFAEEFTAAVEPKIVIFSQARGEHERPSKEIMQGVRTAAPKAYVSCTQLSRGCDKRELHETAMRMDITLPAAGRSKPRGACCGGPIEIAISDQPARLANAGAHDQFVRDEVKVPLCRMIGPMPAGEPSPAWAR